MEQKESCETQLYGDFNNFSYGEFNKLATSRKNTVNVEENHSVLEPDLEKAEELVAVQESAEDKLEVCSNDEIYGADSFGESNNVIGEEQNLEVSHRQNLGSLKLGQNLGYLTASLNSTARIVSSRRGNKKKEEMKGFLK